MLGALALTMPTAAPVYAQARTGPAAVLAQPVVHAPPVVHPPAVVRAPAAARVAVPQVAAPPRAPIPIVLPRPVPITNPTSSTLFSALLAITRAQQIDPQAAQTAAFAYVQAVQQYRLGNFAAANISALSALATAGGAQVQRIAPTPLPTPALVAQPAQLPGLAGGPYGGDAPAIDAGSFLALARGIIDDCGARRDHRLATAKTHYAQAEQDFAARNFEATRIDAKAAIDACAKPQP